MSAWWQSLAQWLVDYYVLATLLLAAAFVCLVLIRQPARRLAVGWAAMGSLALLAILVAVPGWPRLGISPEPDAPAVPVGIGVSLAPATDLGTGLREKDGHAGPSGASPAQDYELVISEKELRGLMAAGASDEAPANKARSSSVIPARVQRARDKAGSEAKVFAVPTDWEIDWAGLAIGLFVAGAALSLAWLGLGAIQVRWLRRHSYEAPANLQALLRRVVGDRKPPRLLLSPQLSQPVATGTFRPIILLPAQSASGAAESQLEAVLAHEWAHIGRGDLWLLALSRWLLAALFAHPLYWWLRGRIREDQEALADAAAAGADGAIDYAATLLHWVRLGRKRRGAAAALALWGKPSELKRRITMLLNPQFPVETRCPGHWRWGAMSLMGVGVLALSVLTLRPLPPATAEAPPAKPAAPAKKDPPKTPQIVDADVEIAIETRRAILDVYGAMPVPSPAAKAPPRPKAGEIVKFAGRVDNHDKKPVADAPVTVIAWQSGNAARPQVLAQAKTDAKGRYQVQAKMPADNPNIAVVVSAKGYGQGWSFLQPGAEAVIRLAPEQIIRGRLIDLQGEGAANVKIQVCRIGPRPAGGPGYYYRAVPPAPVRVIKKLDGNMMMAPKADVVEPAALSFMEPPANLPFWPKAVTTDSQGRFTLQGIGRGQGVGLQIRDPRYAMQALDVPPAKDKPATVTLVLSQARVIDGTVTDADTGKPIPGARLRIPSARNRLVNTVFFANGRGGDADWKGRRMSNQYQTLAFFDPYGPGGMDELPGIDVRADKEGKFRVPLFLANSYGLEVTAEGEPYFHRTQTVGWPKAAARQTVRVTLRRGIWLHGEVTEKPSGKAVANARIDFWGPAKLPEGVPAPGTLTTAADGTFKVLMPAGAWKLMVNGATSDFVVQKVPAATLVTDQALRVSVPNGPVQTFEPNDKKKFFYPDGYTAVELKPRSDPQDVAVELRREVFKGKLIGPDGKPVAKASMFYHHPLPFPSVVPPKEKTSKLLLGYLNAYQPLPSEPAVRPIEVRDGQFEVPVRDVEATYQLYFLDAEKSLGALAEVNAKKARAKEPTVQLAPCGSAKARFVDEKGKPLEKFSPELWMLLPPGPHALMYQPGNHAGRWANGLRYAAFSPDGKVLAVQNRIRLWQELVASPSPAHNQISVRQADPLHYGKGPFTDAKGDINLPALISGATYRLITVDGQTKEFKAESGKTLDLKQFTIKQPPPPPNNLVPPPPLPPVNVNIPLELKTKVDPNAKDAKPTPEKPKK
jgi:beta-lactamase regulating signal transducer with metallopeptidase domain